MNKRILTRSILSLIIAPLLLAAPAFAQETKLPAIRVDDQALKRDDHSSFAPIIERVAPSVVTISTEATAGSIAKENDRFSDPLFRRFFGLPDEDEGLRKKPAAGAKKLIPTGLGSGVVISADGYILTNHHVVNKAEVITVTLADGITVKKAKKVASDEGSDIAVIKIDAENLSPITFADSDKARVGDIVLAIGSPFAFRQSVTKGIISAVGRAERYISEYANFIQTDASINPGNSGGALIDTQGRLVGIPTAIYSRTGGNMGIGFAVPANQARNVMESLLKHGRVVRGFIGIKMDEVTEQLSKSLGLPDTHGIVVSDVVKDGAAAKAGVKAEDVIVELNGKKFESLLSFRNAITATEPGSKVDLKIFRNGEPMTITVTIGDLGGAETVSLKPAADPVAKVPDVLDGIQVGDITAQQRKQLGVDGAVRGAIVTEVGADTLSAEAGLKLGDVIISINGKEVNNAEEAVKLSEEIKQMKSVRLRVHRAGQTRFVIVEDRKE